MTELVKGQNAPLSSSDVVIGVDSAAPIDLSALLVTSTGKVRSDADFIFFNQPNGPGVTLRDGRLHVATPQITDDITAVRAVITLEDASGRFGSFAPPVAHLSDPAGNRLATYTITGLGTESVVIAVEVYQRNGQWKVRAVGQGYAGGFADLVTDHGVQVDDAPAPPAAPAPAPAPPAPNYGSPAPNYGSPTPNHASPAPSYGSAPVPGSPAPDYGSPAPSYGSPAPAYGAPPTAPTPAAPTGEVSLSKDRPVSLAKGQKVSLRKEGGVALTTVQMGLGWDPIVKKGLFGTRTRDIDLDASVLLFSGGQALEAVYYGELRSRDGSIVHSGDNLTGEGAGDDEVVHVDLTRVPAHIDNLVFAVTSYQGQTFQEVANAYCRLIDTTTGAELARYVLTGGTPKTGVIMCVIHREGGGWKLRAVGEFFDGKTPSKAVPYATRFLG
ncbi:MAG: TerD family protein [Gordonia sp. (in: high G+C Gram-positive bacteria)]|uniref:TerD family protein n=1 Tax=Gordonia sp. (in: high G+C Gram-positive bacteria) TaxID=84139 RepID=UPI0039E24AD4